MKIILNHQIVLSVCLVENVNKILNSSQHFQKLFWQDQEEYLRFSLTVSTKLC